MLTVIFNKFKIFVFCSIKFYYLICNVSTNRIREVSVLTNHTNQLYHFKIAMLLKTHCIYDIVKILQYYR